MRFVDGALCMCGSTVFSLVKTLEKKLLRAFALSMSLVAFPSGVSRSGMPVFVFSLIQTII